MCSNFLKPWSLQLICFLEILSLKRLMKTCTRMVPQDFEYRLPTRVNEIINEFWRPTETLIRSMEQTNLTHAKWKAFNFCQRLESVKLIRSAKLPRAVYTDVMVFHNVTCAYMQIGLLGSCNGWRNLKLQKIWIWNQITSILSEQDREILGVNWAKLIASSRTDGFALLHSL